MKSNILTGCKELNCACLPADVENAVLPILEKFSIGKTVDYEHVQGKIKNIRPARVHPYVIIEVTIGERTFDFYPWQLEIKQQINGVAAVEAKQQALF